MHVFIVSRKVSVPVALPLGGRLARSFLWDGAVAGLCWSLCGKDVTMSARADPSRSTTLIKARFAAPPC